MSVSVIIIRQRRKDSLARLRLTVLRSCSRLAPHKSAAGMNELRLPARQLIAARLLWQDMGVYFIFR